MWKEDLRNKNRNADTVTNDQDNFFCNLPTSSYARVVIGVESKDENLWSMEGILAQCHIDDVLRANSHFPSLCQTQTDVEKTENGGMAPQKCCRSWSPANYVAFLSNRSSCLGVTDNDLTKVKSLLQHCAYYYYNRQLSSNCAEDFNCLKHVPTECYARNAAYNLLHYLLEINFIPDHVRVYLDKNEYIIQVCSL